MQQLRRANERGMADHGWLKSAHTFSFAGYYDPAFMGFRSLRVINEDYIAGGEGFGTHPHRDMEIITVVVDGAIEHKDSTGATGVIRPGEVQYMSAGSGVRHSEYNPDPKKETHLLQIWIQPRAAGGEPRYDQRDFRAALAEKPLVLAASSDGREGSIRLKQDADLYLGRLASGQDLAVPLTPQRGAWLQLIRGELSVNGTRLSAGDALAVADESALKITAATDAEFILFDLM